MNSLRPLSGAKLTRAIGRLRQPVPGSKIEAAQRFGVDLSLLIEQIKLSPAERASRMHVLAQQAETVRGAARKRGV